MSKETRHLIVFFAATFAWTWACYTPIALSGHSPLAMPWLALYIAGGMGPSLVGVVMVLCTYDRAARGDFWRRCFSPRRIGLGWWALIGLLFPVVYGAAIAADVALGGARPGLQQLTDLLAQPALWPLAAFLSFMSGPWSEEFGWRGYALDPLLKRYGLVPGTTLLGLAWGVWHLPLFFMPAIWHGQMGFRLEGFWTFIAGNVGLAWVMTWVYVQTNRSILSGMLLHFTSNFTSQLVAPYSDRAGVIRVLITLAVGLAVCLALSRRSQPAAAQPLIPLKP